MSRSVSLSVIFVFLVGLVSACTVAHEEKVQIEFPQAPGATPVAQEVSRKPIRVDSFADGRTSKVIGKINKYAGLGVFVERDFEESRDLGVVLKEKLKDTLSKNGFYVVEKGEDFTITAELILLKSYLQSVWTGYAGAEAQAKFDLVDQKSGNTIWSDLIISTITHEDSWYWNPGDKYADASGIAVQQLLQNFVNSDGFRKAID